MRPGRRLSTLCDAIPIALAGTTGSAERSHLMCDGVSVARILEVIPHHWRYLNRGHRLSRADGPLPSSIHTMSSWSK
jgi:hypothetical protein